MYRLLGQYVPDFFFFENIADTNACMVCNERNVPVLKGFSE